MECVSFEDECGRHRCMHIEPFTKELAWTDKWFRVISTIMLFEQVDILISKN